MVRVQRRPDAKSPWVTLRNCINVDQAIGYLADKTAIAPDAIRATGIYTQAGTYELDQDYAYRISGVNRNT